MSTEHQAPPANVDQSAPALAPVPLLGSFFFPHNVRGPELIARTVMRSPWPAGQWIETRDDSGKLVEISCLPPCWFELLPNAQDEPARPERQARGGLSRITRDVYRARLHLLVSLFFMNLRKSEHLDDWYVIDAPHGAAKPEGSRAECLTIVSAVKAGKTHRGGKRIAVTFYPDGHAKFYSPRNCDGSPGDMVRIDAREIPAWVEHATSVLANVKVSDGEDGSRPKL